MSTVSQCIKHYFAAGVGADESASLTSFPDSNISLPVGMGGLMAGSQEALLFSQFRPFLHSSRNPISRAFPFPSKSSDLTHAEVCLVKDCCGSADE